MPPVCPPPQSIEGAHRSPAGLWSALAALLTLISTLLAMVAPSAAIAQIRGQVPQFDELPVTTGVLPDAPAPPAAAPREAGTAVPAPTLPDASSGDRGSAPKPFGHNLFQGNFLRTRQDGLNPNYIVMPGDRVAVQTWGALTLQDVFVVDGQGNIFLPEVGPVPLEGVRNADLTGVVERHIKRVYVRHFGVYTNLLTAKPVAVFVTGGVTRPGSYAGVPSDSILFFLDQAGGIDRALGSYRHIQVLRAGKPLADADLYDFILRGSLQSPQWQDGDTILVGQRGPVVELRGQVVKPALIELKQEPATGAEALAVVPKAALANQVTLRGIRQGNPFQRTLTTTQFAATPLHHGDVVELRDDGRTEAILVHLDGEFEGPSTLSVKRGARLVDVLNHVPVRGELSNLTGVHLRRTSVAQAQKDAINDSLFRLERSTLLALSASQGESNIRVKEAELMQKFAERARLIDPLGRVVTRSQGVQRNILLEDGDVVVIPARTNVVRVGGEVQMSNAIVHVDGERVEDYIEAAGGYSDRADEDKVILLHADASVEIVEADHPVQAGDEILVPPRVDTKLLQNAVDVSQVIYQIAVAAGVVLSVAL